MNNLVNLLRLLSFQSQNFDILDGNNFFKEFHILHLLWFIWELCVMIYTERFFEMTNAALKCSNCTDKLCTQYCQKCR